VWQIQLKQLQCTDASMVYGSAASESMYYTHGAMVSGRPEWCVSHSRLGSKAARLTAKLWSRGVWDTLGHAGMESTANLCPLLNDEYGGGKRMCTACSSLGPCIAAPVE
jgi:hypothetical protein